MSDIFREVDEIMHQERMQKLWDEYGNFLIAFVVLTIVLTAAISGYRSWNENVRLHQTSVMMEVLEDPEFPQLVTDLNLELRPGLKALTKLKAAAGLVEDGRSEDALKIYEDLAANTSLPADLKDLAVLMKVRLAAWSGASNVQPLIAQLNSITRNLNSPWQNFAYLEAALLESHYNENHKIAIDYLGRIGDTEAAPPALERQAEALRHVINLRLNNSGQNETATEEGS